MALVKSSAIKPESYNHAQIHFWSPESPGEPFEFHTTPSSNVKFFVIDPANSQVKVDTIAALTGTAISVAGVTLDGGDITATDGAFTNVTVVTDVTTPSISEAALGAGITWTGDLNMTGDLDVTGTVTVSSTAQFNSSVDINSGTVARQILPETDSSYSLGSNTLCWSNVWTDGLSNPVDISIETTGSTGKVYHKSNGGIRWTFANSSGSYAFYPESTYDLGTSGNPVGSLHVGAVYPVTRQTYTTTAWSASRSLNPTTATLAQVAQFAATIAEDLRAFKVFA